MKILHDRSIMVSEYIPYIKAIEHLRSRLEPAASPEEMAEWVFLGKYDGGLTAYTNANELNPPPKFFYENFLVDDYDYVKPLMACWFSLEEITNFHPTARFISGKSLIERWSKHPGIQPEAFICAMIEESRLMDFHPITGVTLGSSPDISWLPPLESALFEVSRVEAIERDVKLITSSQSQLDNISEESQKASGSKPEHQTLNNRIINNGVYWSITYLGKTIHIKNVMGLRYIAWLIQNQGKEILVSELYYAINRTEADSINITYSKMTADQLEEQGLKVGALDDAGDTITPEVMYTLKKSIISLRERIEDARERGDESNEILLEQELQQALDYLRVNTGLGGRSRKARSNLEKIRVSVTQNISRAIKNRISPKFPELGSHLDDYINTGTTCIYKPNPPVDWTFSES